MAVHILSNNGKLVRRSDLDTAVNSPDAVGKTIIVTGTESITSSMEIPSGVAVKCENGGILDIATGVTVEFLAGSTFYCGLSQCFDCAGTGTVVFGSGSVTEIYPEWWGTTTSAFQKSVDAATTSNIPIAMSGDYTIDTVSTASTGRLSIHLTGSITHQAASTGDMLICSELEYLHITGGGTISGNQSNQTADRTLINASGTHRVKVDNIDFTDVRYCAILTGEYANEADNVSVEHCTFTDGMLHNGTYSCVFIRSYPALLTSVDNCKFIQTLAPVGTECRNPTGVVFASSSSTKQLTVRVTNNYFENLGHHYSGQQLAPADVYGYRDTVLIENNTLRTSRMMGLRVTNFGTCKISNNTIIQDCDNIQDGGTTYTSAAPIIASLVNRGYGDNKRINYSAEISNNTINSSGNGLNIRVGIICWSDSDASTYYYNSCDVRGNTVTYSVATASRYAVHVAGVKQANIVGNSFINLDGVKISESGATSVSSLVKEYAIINNHFSGGGIGIYYRELVGSPVTNAHTHVLNNVFDITSLSYTIRYSGTVFVSNNKFPNQSSGNGDTASNVAFWYTNNQVLYNSDPAGATTNTYYRLIDNAGRPDIKPTGGATASVADGGTITHGFGSTPTFVLATPSITSEMVSVTAKSSTTFTVAIKKHDNTAGTTQTIYWQCG